MQNLIFYVGLSVFVIYPLQKHLPEEGHKVDRNM
jgi:hypothetical protein